MRRIAFCCALVGLIGAVGVAMAQNPGPNAPPPDPNSVKMIGDRFKPLTYREMTPEQKKMFESLISGERRGASGPFNVLLLCLSGVIGYVFVKLGCEPAPFLLGMVLGPQLEEFFRRAMLLSRGDPLVFLQRPLSLALLLFTAFLLVLVILPTIRKARVTTFAEEG